MSDRAQAARSGRKGLTAELDRLRNQMRSLGFSYDEIAAELSRRYQARPREAYRLAWGWTLTQAAERFNERAAREGTDPPRGLDVELAVYCDETAFDVLAEIVVTVRGQGDGGGQVCVADDGGLTWGRDYLAEAAALPGPGLGRAADSAGIAGLVVEAVTRAMALLRPAGAGRTGDG